MWNFTISIQSIHPNFKSFAEKLQYVGSHLTRDEIVFLGVFDGMCFAV